MIPNNFNITSTARGMPSIHSKNILPSPIKHLFLFLSILFLTSCTTPICQNVTYDLEEFMIDSYQVSQGKLAILQLESQEQCISSLDNCFLFEEKIVDGDVLTIAVYCPQRQDRVAALQTLNEQMGFQVCNGKIYLPHLTSAEIEIEGLTLKEAQEKIQTFYLEQLPQARIFINFKKRHERQVQIIGGGNSMVNLEGATRLSEVLAKADIPMNANLFKSYIMRDDQQLPIDLYKLIHQGDENQNIIMQGGDQIFIAAANDAMIMVTGEVPLPQTIPAPYGFISLREALALVGGVPYTANKACIQIVRGDFIRPKIYSLQWKDIVNLPQESLLLIPGDVVVVSEKPITQWNRFISQLYPNVAGVQTTYNLYQIFNSIH